MSKTQNEKEEGFSGFSLFALVGLGVLAGLFLKRLVNYGDNPRSGGGAYSKRPPEEAAKVGENVKAIAKKRRLEILKFVKLKGSVSSSELKRHFKGIHERTLRRDLAWLEKEGLLLQKGSTRDSRYFIKQ